MIARAIYCTGCQGDVNARLTSGVEIYPHRTDLAALPFWRCDECKNFVGCHHKTSTPTRPLGCIPTPEIKRARSEIHRVLDPIWKRGKMKRGKLYCKIADKLGWESYHTADLRSIEDAREVYKVIVNIRKDLGLTRGKV